jgi:hypothetical protein
MSRPIATALLCLLASCPASARDPGESAPAPPRQGAEEEEERAILGWQCDHWQVLPGGMRSYLQAPRIYVPDAADKGSATGNHFDLYKDKVFGKWIEARASWNNQPARLDRASNDVKLYFTIYGGPFRRGILIFESEDGRKIHLPVRKQVVNNIGTDPPSTAIEVSGETARRFLEYSRYKVYHQGRSRLRPLEPVELFSFETAASHYSESLAMVAPKLEDPARLCTPLLAPLPQESDII